MTDGSPDPTPDGQRPAGGQPSADISRAEGAGSESDGGRCFLCGRAFHPSYAEPLDAGGGVELCVSCGVLYGLPACC